MSVQFALSGQLSSSEDSEDTKSAALPHTTRRPSVAHSTNVPPTDLDHRPLLERAVSFDRTAAEQLPSRLEGAKAKKDDSRAGSGSAGAKELAASGSVKSKKDDRAKGSRGKSDSKTMDGIGGATDSISAMSIKDGQADTPVVDKLARAVAKMAKLNASLVRISHRTLSGWALPRFLP